MVQRILSSPGIQAYLTGAMKDIYDTGLNFRSEYWDPRTGDHLSPSQHHLQSSGHLNDTVLGWILFVVASISSTLINNYDRSHPIRMAEHEVCSNRVIAVDTYWNQTASAESHEKQKYEILLQVQKWFQVCSDSYIPLIIRSLTRHPSIHTTAFQTPLQIHRPPPSLQRPSCTE
jgi:hypothetical protein